MIDHLEIHVQQLCEEHGIQRDYKNEFGGMMFVEESPPRIEVPPIQTRHMTPVQSYMVSLHEIGHCVKGHTQGRPPHQDKTYYFDHGVLRCEAEAWDWALDERVRDFDFTVADCAMFASRCFGSYIRSARMYGSKWVRLGNGNRDHVSFKYDDPDGDYVQQVYRRLCNACLTEVTG